MCAALVLGDAHAIDQDGAFRLHVGIGCKFEVFARQAGLPLDVGPLRAFEVIDKRLDTDGMAADEIPVQDLGLFGGTRGFICFHQRLSSCP